MIKLILFDLGGVILNVPSNLYYAYLSKESGLPSSRIEVMMKPIIASFESGNMSIKEFERRAGSLLGISAPKVRWLEFLKEESSLNRDVAEFAADLRKDYPVAFLSNVDIRRYTYVKGTLMRGMDHVFDYRFISHELGVVKPSMSVYRKVIKATGLRPSEILFIDDLQSNVKGARKAGIRAVQFKGLASLKLGLKRFGIKLR